MAWGIAESWAAATEVVAMAYGVDVAAVRAPSRGRGPRPILAVRAPRKMAVHLCALVSGADYAAIGRHVGLSKDTVSSHCAEGRESAMDDSAQLTSETLEQMVRAKLILADQGYFRDANPRRRRLIGWELRRMGEALIAAAGGLLASDEAAGSSDLHPTACERRAAA